MKKLFFIFAVALSTVVNAQSDNETITINQIVTSFESINDMILTNDKLNSLYNILSKLDYNHSVLLTLDDYTRTETQHIYGYNHIFEQDGLINNGLDKLIRISIDSSNIYSNSRSTSNTQINISVTYRNESHDLIRTILNIHMRFGVIVWIYAMTNAPTENVIIE
jgi:hypothetical protein